MALTTAQHNTVITVQIVPGPGFYSASLAAAADRAHKSKPQLVREIAEAHHSYPYTRQDYWKQFAKSLLCVVHADIYGWTDGAQRA